MSFSASAVRSFLLRSPKPSSVRVSREDGEPQVLKGIRSYARAADTIVALRPELVECLDKDGNILRAINADGADSNNPSGDVEVPAVLATDPLAAAFMMYGKLIAKAYEHSTEVAFSKMVELVERMNDRSDNIEKRLERSESAYRQVQQDRIDDAFDRVDEAAEKATEGDPLQSMIGQAFLGGMMGKQPPPPGSPSPRPPTKAPRPRTNGQHTKGEA